MRARSSSVRSSDSTTAVPRLGEHTHEVLAQAGVPADTVAAWLASGTVQTHAAHKASKP